jgi:DNA polymerase elongation subunit (family B)
LYIQENNLSKFYTEVFQRGNTIFVRGYENGRRVQKKVNYSPYLFVTSQDQSAEYKTLEGFPVEKLTFDNVREARTFVDQYKDVSNFNIYGLTNYLYAYLNDEYPGKVQYDYKDIRTVYLDIECAPLDDSRGFPNVRTANQTITAITCKFRGHFMTFGCGEFVPHLENLTYVKCDDEKELLRKFVDYWTKIDPDVVSGWNLALFDIPYIINRINRVLGETWAKKLSPWGMVNETEVQVTEDRYEQSYDICGVCVLDYMELYKKFTYVKQESYSLNHIAKAELGEEKLDYSEYKDLTDFYRRNYQKYVEYNIRDSELIDRLEAKLGLISLGIILSYKCKIRYDDMFTSVKLWDIIIHNYLMDRNIVVPLQKTSNKSDQYAGAYVRDPIVGMHKWVATFDINSLYPSLIVQNNMSPETFMGMVDLPSVEDLLNMMLPEHIKDKILKDNLSLGANGSLWDNSVLGIFPALVLEMYAERVGYQNLMKDSKKQHELTPTEDLANKIVIYNILQMVTKILLNSLYGATGNPTFRYYKLEFAEGITLTGKLVIQWVTKDLNSYLNKTLGTTDIQYVVYGDTDSIFVCLDGLVQKVFGDDQDVHKVTDFINKVCIQKIEKIIKKSFENLREYLNSYTNQMKMKRENIANRAIFIAKKKYIMNVYDSEGFRYKEPKLYIKGVETVRSSTPQSCRDSIKECLKIIMGNTNDDLIAYIENFQDKFNSLPVSQIAFPRTCNNLGKYTCPTNIYKPKTPMHVRASLLHNKLVLDKKLKVKYNLIAEGDKMKFCYLSKPNPIRENIIAFTDEFPEEFDLTPYIDRETQFEKAFLNPVQSICDVIGWKTKNISTLEDFFN